MAAFYRGSYAALPRPRPRGINRHSAIPKKYKELLGLVASLVLRCDDCIAYHVAQAQREGASREEIAEALAIGLVIGGSITIPHLRRVFEGMEESSKAD